MKKFPSVIFALGFVSCLMRLGLYLTAVDEKNLLLSHHPLEAVIWLTAAAALVLIALFVRRQDGSNAWEDNVSPSPMGALGHFAGALGIAVTVLLHEPAMAGYIGVAWDILGKAGVICLALAGAARLRGKQPFFALLLIPSLFFMLHIVNHYQSYSANPQLQDYLFGLLGTMALMFFCYYSSAFTAGLGKRRMQLFMGLAAVYLLMADLATTDYLWLDLGGCLLAGSNLVHLTPVPVPEETEPDETEKEE